MAPFQSIIEAQPRLDLRQDPQLYAITLTVTRATSTLTTIMILGGATKVPQDNPTVNTTPVSSPNPIVVSDSSDPSNNTGVVIGATIGALAGTLLLIILIWKCCYFSNTARFSGRYYDSDTSTSSSSSHSSHRRRPSAGFSRRDDRGHRVTVPRRTYSRREKLSSHGSSSRSRSDSTWMRNRRSGGWGNGLFGWVTGTNIRRTRSVYVRRESGTGGRRYGEPRFSVDD